MTDAGSSPHAFLLVIKPDAVVFWAFVVAWLIVFAIFALRIVPRIVKQGHRIVTHVIDLPARSPLPLAAAKAASDVDRLNRALERVPALLARAEGAVRTIRSTPIVPPSLAPLVARIRFELVAFRRQR